MMMYDDHDLPPDRHAVPFGITDFGIVVSNDGINIRVLCNNRRQRMVIHRISFLNPDVIFRLW